ncbi:MAG: ribose 5-phosphate isomerase B [Chloroflexi bacterium]|nr:ribose 5-phosphate isomerase B [Chloroflexota bacterium]
MRIAVGSDHRGLELKKLVIKWLTDAGFGYEDFGCYTAESVDYPDIAKKVAQVVARGDFERGILICGTGIGMCIAANKVKGIRAALCYDTFSACRARQHNDANVLCLGAERESEIPEILDGFLTCQFEAGRHQRRLDKIKEMEA